MLRCFSSYEVSDNFNGSSIDMLGISSNFLVVGQSLGFSFSPWLNICNNKWQFPPALSQCGQKSVGFKPEKFASAPEECVSWAYLSTLVTTATCPGDSLGLVSAQPWTLHLMLIDGNCRKKQFTKQKHPVAVMSCLGYCHPDTTIHNLSCYPWMNRGHCHVGLMRATRVWG